MQKISPFLWFDNEAEAAARFYVSIFGNSRIISASPMMTIFELDGIEVMALNGGPSFKFNEAFSLFVKCETQAEVDYFWDKLRQGGGSEGRCGWLKDRYGLSWQVAPNALARLLGDKDREKANRAMQAMLQMKKLIVADLEQAFAG